MPECQKIENGELDHYGAERFTRLILPQSENVELKGLISVCSVYTHADIFPNPRNHRAWLFSNSSTIAISAL